MSNKYAIVIDVHGNEVEVQVKKTPKRRYEESESEYEESDEESESEYEESESEEDLELIEDNKTKIIHKKRTRKKTQFFKDLIFKNGREDQYDRASGFTRNNWFGRKGENTIIGEIEDNIYYRKKLNEVDYERNDFVV